MSYRPTRLTYLLITLVLIEIGLVVSLRQLGWWETGDLLFLIFSVAAIALPIAIMVLILVINRFRIGLRSLFVLMVILSLFEMDFDPALLSKLAESESLKTVSVGIRKKVNSEVWRNEETFDLDDFRDKRWSLEPF